MSNYSGKLIVIDGTDGSGKTTQLNLLKNKLESEGYEVMVADFPQYNQKSAGLVENYLSGKYGQADEVTPYQASVFYAADRFDASFEIRNWLKNGKIVYHDETENIINEKVLKDVFGLNITICEINKKRICNYFN